MYSFEKSLGLWNVQGGSGISACIEYSAVDGRILRIISPEEQIANMREEKEDTAPKITSKKSRPRKQRKGC